MSDWTECDPAIWKRELHGMTLRVDDPDHAERTHDDMDAPEDPGAPWVWRVFRTVDRFTEIELESGREETCKLAMSAAEVAAGTWR